MKKFTPEDDKFLRENYLVMTIPDLAKTLGRSGSGVFNRFKILGLKLPKEIIHARYRMAAKLQMENRGRFKAMHEPWNKGTKGLMIGGEETQFKKGNIPANFKPLGTERYTKEGYIEVKVGHKKWELKHRIIWKQHYELPKGMIVKFKDGNRLNIVIENLYITDRKQNMADNTIYRYPPELIKAIKLNSKLIKSIDNESKH